MQNEVKIKGTVEKVVRAYGQTDAQVVITVPVSVSAEVPLGAVTISIQSLQSAMFGKDTGPMKLDAKKGGRGSKK